MWKRPDARLLSAVPFVRPCAAVADIGTDHAYLPIFLIREGIASRALACDIGKGPLSRAKEHIAAAGFSDRIGTLLTDGLHGVESFCPDHILIFGMGGELIAKILSEAPWIRSPSVRLILQPMSRAQCLRAFLWETGFGTVGESLTEADGRIYQTVCAAWSGESTPFSAADALVGKPEFHRASPLCPALLARDISILRDVLRGKSLAKQTDLSADEELLHDLESRLREIGGTA